MFSRIFGSKPEDIDAIDLKEWIDKAGRRQLEQIRTRYSSCAGSIEEKKTRINLLIEKLRDEELQNMEIPQREYHLMLGNRDAYIRKIEALVAGLAVPKLDVIEIEKFCEDSAHLLEETGKATSRSYFILKNFFAGTVVEISSTIKGIEKDILALKDLTKDNIFELYEEAHNLNKDVMESARLSEQRLGLEQENAGDQKKLESMKNKLQALSISQECREFKEIIEKKEHSKKKLSDLENDFLARFSPARDMLRRLFHDEPNLVLAGEYVEDPIKALFSDPGSDIIPLIEKAKELQTKKKNPKIDREYLQKTRESMRKLQQTVSESNSGIEKSSISMNYKELEYQIEHMESRIRQGNSELQKVLKKIEDISLDRTKIRLEQKIESSLKKKITIRL